MAARASQRTLKAKRETEIGELALIKVGEHAALHSDLLYSATETEGINSRYIL